MSSAKDTQNMGIQQSKTQNMDTFVNIPGSASLQPISPVNPILQQPTFVSNNLQGFPMDPNCNNKIKLMSLFCSCNIHANTAMVKARIGVLDRPAQIYTGGFLYPSEVAATPVVQVGFVRVYGYPLGTHIAFTLCAWCLSSWVQSDLGINLLFTGHNNFFNSSILQETY